jgi:hypothetical protein
MDIACSRCGEPWDTYTFHDVAEEQGITYNEATANFRRRGCEATGWGSCNSETTAHPGIGILAELAGDDIDGLAADLEDFGLI